MESFAVKKLECATVNENLLWLETNANILLFQLLKMVSFHLWSLEIECVKWKYRLTMPLFMRFDAHNAWNWWSISTAFANVSL